MRHSIEKCLEEIIEIWLIITHKRNTQLCTLSPILMQFCFKLEQLPRERVNHSGTSQCSRSVQFIFKFCNHLTRALQLLPYISAMEFRDITYGQLDICRCFPNGLPTREERCRWRDPNNSSQTPSRSWNAI